MTTNREVKMLDETAMSELFVGRKIVGWDGSQDTFFLDDGVTEFEVEISDPEMAYIGEIQLCETITSVRIVKSPPDPWDMTLSPNSIYSIYVTTESEDEVLLFWVTVFRDEDSINVQLKVENSSY